jgi:hypothetical protein
MISDRTIKQWFRGRLINDVGIDSTAIAYENRAFDSSGVDLYYRERYAVAAEGITTNGESAKTGLIWYDAIVPTTSGTEDADDAVAAIATELAPYDNKEVQIQSGLKIDIDEATSGERGEGPDDTHYMISVRIEFRAYEVTN